jgi:Leucine-rich repeat (LRR) protein
VGIAGAGDRKKSDAEIIRGTWKEVSAKDGDKLVITPLQAHQAEIVRYLPDWLKPYYNRGLLANLDDDRNVVSITAGEVVTDELLGKLKTLPKLRELDIETTKLVTADGLKALAELSSLQKLTLYCVSHDGRGLGDTAIQSIVGLKSLCELRLNQCGTTDAGIRQLEAMPYLTHLDVYQEGHLTDTAIASIAKLKRLKHLSLDSYVGTEHGWMRFSKEAIQLLAWLQELEHLHLVGQSVSPETLQFPRLRTLSLGSVDVTDACAARIAQCRQLQSLVLVYTNITDDGLNKLADLPELGRLNLDSHVVTDAGIKHIKRLPKLQHISLRASRLTDESLRHLAEIKTLTRVDLNGSSEPGVSAGKCFTIVGVQQLKALPNLRTLWLTNFESAGGFLGLKDLIQLRELTMMMTNIREEELEALEEALPNTRIYHATGGGGFRPTK